MIPRRPTSRVRPAVATAVALIGFLMILVRLTGTDPMSARLADLRARGLPASAGEMERMVPAAPLASRTAVLDASTALSHAFSGYNPTPLDELAVKPARDWTPSDREAAGAAEPVLEGPVADLHVALAAGRVPLGWATDPRTGGSRYRIFDLINAQSALSLQARAALAAGDSQAATDRATDMLRLGRSLHPTDVFSLIGRLSVESTAVKLLGEIAGSDAIEPSHLESLAQESHDRLGTRLEVGAWTGERLLMLYLWNSASGTASSGSTGARPRFEAAARQLYRWGGWDRADRVAYFDLMERVIAAAGREGPERAAAVAALPFPSVAKPFLGLVNPVLNIVTPRPHGLLREADTLRFKAEAARTALTVARWRSRHGRWPESLGEVFPDAGGVRHPIDPRSGQPLRWETTDVGFRIVGTPDADPKPLDDEDDRSLAIPVPAPPRP